MRKQCISFGTSVILKWQSVTLLANNQVHSKELWMWVISSLKQPAPGSEWYICKPVKRGLSFYWQYFRSSHLKTHHFPHPTKWKPHSFILVRIFRAPGFLADVSQDCWSLHEPGCDTLSSKRSISTETDVDIRRHSVLLPCDFLSKFAFVLSVGELHGMTIDATSERSYDGNEGWGGERNRLVN